STTDGPSDIDAYSCTVLDESGPELAYRYSNDSGSLRRLTAELSGMTSDHDLFLLLDDCDPEACVAHSASGATAMETAAALVPDGEQIFVVVDGYGGNSGPFTLEVSVEAVEADCADGTDDDGDGSTDCADADCIYLPACAATCSPGQPMQCGDLGLGQTTGGGTALLHYPGLPEPLPGPERIFTYDGGDPGMVLEVTLTSIDGALYLLALEGECSTANLVAADTVRVQVEPLPDTSYHLVVDGADPVGAQFGLALDCRESACDDSADNDGDGATDCADPDCLLAASCVVSCTPLDGDAGCVDAGCYLLEASPLAGFCHPPGDAGPGDPCDAQQECRQGHVCAPAGICLPGCDLSDGQPGCDAGDCHPVGADPLGVCFSAEP
ncbi:MAG: hypothetical protein JRI55_08220, partial [Deltaproteobacteria bacterium]|nr:hypothetical protein [Deltaproteobacteria bacterium]